MSASSPRGSRALLAALSPCRDQTAIPTLHLAYPQRLSFPRSPLEPAAIPTIPHTDPPSAPAVSNCPSQWPMPAPACCAPPLHTLAPRRGWLASRLVPPPFTSWLLAPARLPYTVPRSTSQLAQVADSLCCVRSVPAGLTAVPDKCRSRSQGAQVRTARRGGRRGVDPGTQAPLGPCAQGSLPSLSCAMRPRSVRFSTLAHAPVAQRIFSRSSPPRLTQPDARRWRRARGCHHRPERQTS
jgi:hypothetical protein